MRWLALCLLLLAHAAYADPLDEPSVDPACYAKVIAANLGNMTAETDRDIRWSALIQTLDARASCLSTGYINTCTDTKSWADSIACHASVRDRAEANMLVLVTRPLPPLLSLVRTQLTVDMPRGCLIGPPPRDQVSEADGEMICDVRSDLAGANFYEALLQIGDATPYLWQDR